MGREWKWTRSFRRAGNGGGEEYGGNGRHTGSPAGCMGSVLHLFDVQKILLFSGGRRAAVAAGEEFGRRRLSPGRGLEAPRNSLEIEAPQSSGTCSMDFSFSEQLEIPFGIQVVPRRRTRGAEEEEEARSSGGSHSARTGNVVARLMGLDHVPDRRASASFSPRTRAACYERGGVELFPSPGTHSRKKASAKELSGSRTPPSARAPLQPRCGNVLAEVRHGTRSLPETPRASLARRSWDSDPRLSLRQAREENGGCFYTTGESNKENNPINLTPSAILELRSICTDHSALLLPPAPQGLADGKTYAREIVRQVKDSVSRRIGAAATAGGGNAADRQPVVARSMRRVRGSFEMAKPEPPPCTSSWTISLDPPHVEAAVSPAPMHATEHRSAGSDAVGNCRKASLDRFTERLKKPPAPAPRKNALVPPHPARGGKASSSPPARGCPRDGENRRPSRSPPPGRAEESEEYVRALLHRTGKRWYSSSHPLDPILFHQLELCPTTSHFHGHLRRRCNRKLLFDLVDEALADTLWLLRDPAGLPEGEPLVARLLAQISAHPSVDCHVMEDIDALVELDLPEGNVRRLLRHPAVAEEAEAVAAELQGTLLDRLLDECVRQVLTRPRGPTPLTASLLPWGTARWGGDR